MLLLIPKEKKEIKIEIFMRLLNFLIIPNVILLQLNNPPSVKYKQDLHVICCIHILSFAEPVHGCNCSLGNTDSPPPAALFLQGQEVDPHASAAAG